MGCCEPAWHIYGILWTACETLTGHDFQCVEMHRNAPGMHYKRTVNASLKMDCQCVGSSNIYALAQRPGNALEELPGSALDETHREA